MLWSIDLDIGRLSLFESAPRKYNPKTPVSLDTGYRMVRKGSSSTSKLHSHAPFVIYFYKKEAVKVSFINIKENQLRADILRKTVAPDDLIRHFGEKVFIYIE